MLKYSIRLLFSATNVIVVSNSICRIFRSHGNAHGQTRDENNDATVS